MDRVARRVVQDLSEARFTKPREECPHPEFWTSDDDQATEHEVVAGVRGLIRMLQPEYVLETGTHTGTMARAITGALRENGHGRLDTVELDEDLHRAAVLEAGDVGSWCNYRHGDSLEFEPAGPIDFAWLDSASGDHRIREFERFYPHMHERTIVGFHDCGTHYNKRRLLVLQLFQHGMIIPIFLPTPRGVALCQVIPPEEG